MAYSFSKKKNGWKWKLSLILLLVSLTIVGMFKLFPSTYMAVKHDALNMVGLTEKNGLEKDSVVVITNVPPVKKVDKPNVKKQDDIYSIPIEVNGNVIKIIANLNGYPIKFMLDTGCSDMHLSMAELYYLQKMGVIDANDSKGNVTCTYADGSSHECPLYIFKEVSFSESIKVNNVQCTVDESLEATPLLGNAVLSKLGKVSVDYKKRLLIIEK